MVDFDKEKVVAEFFVPNDLTLPTTVRLADVSNYPKERIVGTIERVVEITYSEEVHGKIDAIYANGVRFVPEAE